MAGLAPKKRGRKHQLVEPLAARIARLEREKLALEDRLRRAETIIEIQKKVSHLLGLPLNSPHKGDSNA